MGTTILQILNATKNKFERTQYGHDGKRPTIKKIEITSISNVADSEISTYYRTY